jgi:hypothetical protein
VGRERSVDDADGTEVPSYGAQLLEEAQAVAEEDGHHVELWYDGASRQGQCEGCTTTAWHPKDAVSLPALVLGAGPGRAGRWRDGFT